MESTENLFGGIRKKTLFRPTVGITLVGITMGAE